MLAVRIAISDSSVSDSTDIRQYKCRCRKRTSMADDTETPDGDDTGADVGHDLEAPRTTAPMSEFSARAVVIGVLVAIVGVAVTFGIPLLGVGV